MGATIALVISSTGPAARWELLERNADLARRRRRRPPAAARSGGPAWPGVRCSRIVSISAMPMAPPRLRIRLNSALRVGDLGLRPALERQPRRRQEAEHDADAAQHLRPEQSVEIGRRRCSKPLASRPAANRPKPMAVSRRGSMRVSSQAASGAVSKLRRARHHHDLADLERRVLAHEPEKHRQQIDRAVEAEAEHEAERAAERERTIAEAAQIDERMRARQALRQTARAADTAQMVISSIDEQCRASRAWALPSAASSSVPRNTAASTMVA